MKPSRSYREGLEKALRDPREAAAYLNAALEQGDSAAFLLALRDVAGACGMTELSRRSRQHRVNLYRMLSKNGNPSLSGLAGVLGALGLRLAVRSK